MAPPWAMQWRVMPKPHSPPMVLADRTLTEPFWTWSSSCFFFTLAVYLHLSSIALASQLWWTKTRGWYFLGMVIVALSHLVDLMVTNITYLEYARTPGAMRRILAVVDWLAIWVGFVGFALLNWHRIRAMCRVSRPRLTCVVTVLAASQVLFWTGVTATVLTAFYWRDYSNPIVKDSTYYIFPAFVWDALVNIFTSSAFIFHLYKLHPPPPPSPARPGMTVRFLGRFKSSESLQKSSTSLADSSTSDAPATLYAHMHTLLRRSQILLLLECATMFTAALLPLTIPDADPLNILIFFAESFRTRVFLVFLSDLQTMLRERRRPGGADAGPPAAAAGGTGRRPGANRGRGTAARAGAGPARPVRAASVRDGKPAVPALRPLSFVGRKGETAGKAESGKDKRVAELDESESGGSGSGSRR
ncbi:hypothetical protein AMAG_18368 [Allomyces macrogynus ATCC 38327]|uniref:Uncharacterized protein n=1 Tax=Allomyces macrogynus (strain ATCC 38327) TaxID=578462 RepID=A0A0L0S6M6_ALLM3|nr:hypothetical protein AMAG_18368 [Allomyces macrogynus ATCC 38327]|eukprot:KNE58051.1 hypothetical protein AMAG_18368 [Allomyces macrogynus ATCC 38327]